jgi:hypothetical protein
MELSPFLVKALDDGELVAICSWPGTPICKLICPPRFREPARVLSDDGLSRFPAQETGNAADDGIPLDAAAAAVANYAVSVVFRQNVESLAAGRTDKHLRQVGEDQLKGSL